MSRGALRKLLCSVQFSGNFDSLWDALDRDGNGDLNLEELTPKLMNELANFRAWMHPQMHSNNFSKNLLTETFTEHVSKISLILFSKNASSKQLFVKHFSKKIETIWQKVRKKFGSILF